VTLAYVEQLAELGAIGAITANPELARGVNVMGGRITYEAVAEAHGLEYTPLDDALAAGVTGGAAAATPGKDSTTKTAAASTTQAPAPDKTAPAVGGIGGVKVNAPVELQVFENGNLIGSTAGQIAVLAGSHTFDLVNESLSFRVRSTVLVKGGQLTPLNVNLPNGRVSINAVPWADVTIDGRAVGQTPLANLAVQIGQHLVVFKHPQFGEQQQTVIVKAEGLAKVSATFKQ